MKSTKNVPGGFFRILLDFPARVCIFPKTGPEGWPLRGDLVDPEGLEPPTARL